MFDYNLFISSETSAEITDDSEEIQSEGDAYDGTYTDAEFSEEAPEQEKVYYIGDDDYHKKIHR